MSMTEQDLVTGLRAAADRVAQPSADLVAVRALATAKQSVPRRPAPVSRRLAGCLAGLGVAACAGLAILALVTAGSGSYADHPPSTDVTPTAFATPDLPLFELGVSVMPSPPGFNSCNETFAGHPKGPGKALQVFVAHAGPCGEPLPGAIYLLIAKRPFVWHSTLGPGTLTYELRGEVVAGTHGLPLGWTAAVYSAGVTAQQVHAFMNGLRLAPTYRH